MKYETVAMADTWVSREGWKEVASVGMTSIRICSSASLSKIHPGRSNEMLTLNSIHQFGPNWSLSRSVALLLRSVDTLLKVSVAALVNARHMRTKNNLPCPQCNFGGRASH